MKPKVCILTAGRGKRLERYSEIINKALLPLRGKAIISHIIDKFSIDTEFIIATGYKSQQIINYLKVAHPHHNFSFITVTNYDGLGSGPGQSTLCCKDLLSSSFYFISCDTLWVEDISMFSTEKNWIAVAETTLEGSVAYCNAVVKNEKVIELRDKVAAAGKEAFSFTGLGFIKDTELFWQGLEKDYSVNNEKQVSAGFRGLVEKSSLYFYKINWTDVGTEEKYINEIKKTENYDFSKVNEFIYLFNNRVIKFFQNPKVAELRVQKSRLNTAVFPFIDQHTESFYSYAFQKGQTLYKQTQTDVFEKLIQWLDKNLWNKKNIDADKMKLLCRNFYKAKTYERIEQFEKKYPQHSQIVFINNKKIPSTRQLLSNLNWNILFEGEAYFIHGDLQPDNIIYDEVSDKFTLLDWRQDFAGEIEFGDIYYDLAKLWGGLNLNYDQIKLNNFIYNESQDSSELVFPSHPFIKETQEMLESYIKEKGYSVDKVKLLVGLIYLNMSPLHHFPFDKLLHALGRKIIYETQEAAAID